MKQLPLYAIAILALVSCKDDPKITAPLPVNNLAQVVPQGWPQPKYMFEENLITEDKFILGRFLFYETLLSKDNTVSCGSCHQNFVAFANADHDVSHGIEQRRGIRNSPGIFNLAWHPYFMHDGGANHIEMQPLAPITNTLEMAENINSVIAKLQATQKYRELFKKAYGDEIVNSQRILKTMAQFMGLIGSSNSKYDYYKRKERNVTFSEEELRGYDLFRSHCNSCHTEPLFSDFAFRNNGLAEDPQYKDSGRAHITGLPEDRYRFKTPSLRNVALTYPYMHDGRFATLEECLDHYTSDSKNTVNLDPLLIKPLALSEQDKKDLIAFLNTLTDHTIAADKRFSDPNFSQTP